MPFSSTSCHKSSFCSFLSNCHCWINARVGLRSVVMKGLRFGASWMVSFSGVLPALLIYSLAVKCLVLLQNSAAHIYENGGPSLEITVTNHKLCLVLCAPYHGLLNQSLIFMHDRTFAWITEIIFGQRASDKNWWAAASILYEGCKKGGRWEMPLEFIFGRYRARLPQNHGVNRAAACTETSLLLPQKCFSDGTNVVMI